MGFKINNRARLVEMIAYEESRRLVDEFKCLLEHVTYGLKGVNEWSDEELLTYLKGDRYLIDLALKCGAIEKESE
jgi:hypothetical protein